jgi:hypothetical protein
MYKHVIVLSEGPNNVFVVEYDSQRNVIMRLYDNLYKSEMPPLGIPYFHKLVDDYTLSKNDLIKVFEDITHNEIVLFAVLTDYDKPYLTDQVSNIGQEEEENV